MKYIKYSICIAVAVIFITVGNYHALENTLERTKEFTSESENPSYNGFEKTVIKDGNTYELQKINYTKTNEDKKTEKKNKTTTVVKDNLYSKSYSVDSSASYYHDKVTVDGKEYDATLVDVEYENHTRTNRKGEVSGSTDYGLRTTKPTPPDTKELQYYDSETRQSFTVNAPLTELKTTSTKWQDYTYIDITVSNYTDTQFMFNGKIIKHDGNTVLDSSYYGELLSMAGLKGDNYRVSSLSWTGEAYKKGNVKYRNARADIQAYSCSYKAYYYSSFSLPDIPSYTAKLKYKYSEENVIKTVYTYKATAIYTAEIQETEAVAETEPPTEEKAVITVKTVTTISLIFAASLAFVLLFFFLLTQIKKKNKTLGKLLNKKR